MTEWVSNEFTVKVTVHDSTGKEIDPPFCTCGDPGTVNFQGRDCSVWMCHDCLNPQKYGHTFVDAPPNEGKITEFRGIVPDAAWTDEIKE